MNELGDQADTIDTSTEDDAETKDGLRKLHERINQISCDDAMVFLSGVRKIANELETKQTECLEELAFHNELLPEKLNDLRIQKRELLELREQIISLRDGYLSHATSLLTSLQEQAPELLKTIDEVASKKTKLKRLECDKRGEELISRCQLAITEKDIGALDSAYIDAYSHIEKVDEFPDSSSVYMSKLATTSQSAKELIVTESEAICKTIGYPFDDPIDNRSLKKETDSLSSMLVLLYKISENESHGSGMDAIQSLLFAPVSYKFLYHFYGDRTRTNDVTKPGLMLTQTLSWMQTSLPFFELVIDTVSQTVIPSGSTSSPPHVYFNRSLFSLLEKKIKRLLRTEQVVDSPVIFTKLLDESIWFEEQRREFDSSIDNNILRLFCEKTTLARWIEIENDLCISHLDAILSSDDRWKSRFRDMDDADTYLVCECADSFVALLHSLQHRSSLLSDDDAKRRFIDVQLLLVDDFLQRLAQIARQAESPWSEPFPHIMNAIWYIHDVVDTWSETCILDGLLSSSGERGIFEASSNMYKHVWSQFADEIVVSLRIQTIDLAKQYQRQRWCPERGILQSAGGRDLSPLFCPLLMKIRSAFANASTMISSASVATLFKKMLSTVAKILQHEVVDCTNFNADGASQMLFDIEKGLFPVLSNIFSRSEVDKISPEFNTDMMRVVGSLRLLSMSWAVSTLLRDELKNAPDDVAEEKLLSLQICGMTASQAASLFLQRSDMDTRADQTGMSLR